MRNDAEWQSVLKVLGQTTAAGDERFATACARRQNQIALDEQITRWLAAADAEHTAAALQAAGVCAHVSWTTQNIADDAHLHQRGTLVKVDDPSVACRYAVGTPAKFSKGPDVGLQRGTPELGEHEDYVFGELLGMGRSQRADLESREVIY